MQSNTIPPHLHSLDDFLNAGPYLGYAYSYPHKTAYREFATTRTLSEVWREESKESLFLYAHVPFCEMRCGFCNLFTFSQPSANLPGNYLAAMRRQAEIVRAEIGGGQFSRVAIGGGTPTFLNEEQLLELFAILREMGVNTERTPIGIEASPATLDCSKLELLKSSGVDRLSMGVQSWDADDVGQMGRPQQIPQVVRALEWIRSAGFKTLNLDLIYGAAGQSDNSWLESIDRSLEYAPEEIYLYPLYIRPLTGLSGRGGYDGLANDAAGEQDQRLRLYRLGRDRLLQSGYVQVSMRMFQRATVQDAGASEEIYRCQEDGMIGLGCGARSYTQSLHYADQFAVKQSAVLQIIERYGRQSDEDFRHVRRGIELDLEDRRRRYLILSLLLCEGLELPAFEKTFGLDALEALPGLQELLDKGLSELTSDRLRLTPSGLEQSDAIGPWLYSSRVRNRMEEFAWRDA